MEREMKQKCARELKTVADPVEKLRLTLLKRGTGCIKGLGRYRIVYLMLYCYIHLHT